MQLQSGGERHSTECAGTVDSPAALPLCIVGAGEPRCPRQAGQAAIHGVLDLGELGLQLRFALPSLLHLVPHDCFSLLHTGTAHHVLHTGMPTAPYKN